MPKRRDLSRILIIGSGPIVIGQAAEFDYSGSQACRALREEGYQVILVNNNPATIMTDLETADVVYLEPLTPESLEKVIARERPDALLPTLGGQTGLNLAVQLARAGVLESYGVELLGTPLEAIERAEDREKFRNLMQQIGEPIPPSRACRSFREAVTFAEEVGFPVIVRPAYTLGGTGGGIAETAEDLREIVARGVRWSLVGQVLVEKYLHHWLEIEYEVMRDANGTCITVCNMENIDPMGVHTGDSIVVAPSQTLTDLTYQRLRSASLRVIDALGIQGGCNIQFAVSPDQSEYFVIEVNPRVSRSSALASKATGYPIARIAAKIAVGLLLHEIPNPVTGKTFASFEPALDFVVVKIPRFPFDKFSQADRTLGSQMKATGEVMAIGRNFREALQKAVASLEIGVSGLAHPETASLSVAELREKIATPNDLRLFALAEFFRRGGTVEEAHRLSGIQRFFLHAIAELVREEAEIAVSQVPVQRSWKRDGFTDARIAELRGLKEEAIRRARHEADIRPAYKEVDTCAGEFEAVTPYFYSTYDLESEMLGRRRECVVVVGSGPIRIGQGIEFDYCCVHAVKALQEMGYEAVMVNCNPETVSTDFDTADRLYFEPLTVEHLLEIYDREQPVGLLVQFGGQTPLNLARRLPPNVRILGASLESIDRAEDRQKLQALLRELRIPYPAGGGARSREEALQMAEQLGYPVLVRPSYVLGGRAMEIFYGKAELEDFLEEAMRYVSEDTPLLVDRYLPGVELEVDAVSDGRSTCVIGILQHIERAGVHSGDSIAEYPAPLPEPVKRTIVERTQQLARALEIRGLLNIQFVWHDGEIYVLEVNPRASRTVPFLAKATGAPIIRWAVAVSLGRRLQEVGAPEGLLPESPIVALKAPVFSFAKLQAVEPSLGPEMKSTGEIMSIGRSFTEALQKLFASLEYRKITPQTGFGVLITVADRDKPEVLELAEILRSLGCTLYATSGTERFLRDHGIPAIRVRKIREGSPNLLDVLHSGQIKLILNTVSPSRAALTDGQLIRRTSVELQIPLFTSLDTARVFLREYLAKLVELQRDRGVSPLAAPDWEPISLNELHRLRATAAR